jgi:hypothetical protein
MVDANKNGIDDSLESPFAGVGAYPVQVAQSGSSKPDPKVFWGYDNRKQYSLAEIDAGAPAGGQQDIYRTPENAAAYIAELRASDPEGYQALTNRMYSSGAIGADASFGDVQRAWNEALAFSIDAGVNGTKITPFDSIDLIGTGVPGGAGGARNGTFSSSINETNTDTRRQIKLSSAQEARAFLMAAAERELGRAATADEIAKFREGLNAEEKANATTVTSTSRTTGTNTDTYVDGIQTDSNRDTNTSSSSTETGGMDRGQYSLDAARSANDWAEYQTATTYMQAMFAALDSTVNVSGR